MTQNEKNRLKINQANFSKILQVDHFGQALRRLNKIILLDLASKIGKDLCLTCKDVVTIDNLTIGHIQPWRRCYSREGDKKLFWDIDNICLQCAKHNNADDRTVICESDIGAPPEFENNKNIKDDSTRLYLNFAQEILGIGFGKANHQLFKKIMFTWCKEANLNVCARCTFRKPIIDQKDWTIEHLQPWYSGKTNEEKRFLFYDLSNIAYSHESCNCASANLGKGKSGFNGVDWYENKRTGYANWRARIQIKEIGHITLQHDIDPIVCAEAYDMGLMKYKDSVGIFNFPEKIGIYQERIDAGWREDLKCKICGDKHFGLGYCRKHHYEFCGGAEKRRSRYFEGKG